MRARRRRIAFLARGVLRLRARANLALAKRVYFIAVAASARKMRISCGYIDLRPCIVLPLSLHCERVCAR